jgi:hypothetical protein
MTFPPRDVVEMQLRTVRAECDQPESSSDDAAVRLGRGLKYPKDRGYAKFFAELGCDRNWAGMIAAKIVEEGRVRVARRQKGVELAQRPSDDYRIRAWRRRRSSPTPKLP